MTAPFDTAADRIALSRLFPACFVAPGTKSRVRAKSVLKVGIALDLAAATGWSLERCRAVLGDYCTGPKYLRAITTGDGTRVDLDGNSVGQVSRGERSEARRKLKAIEHEFRQRDRMRRATADHAAA